MQSLYPSWRKSIHHEPGLFQTEPLTSQTGKFFHVRAYRLRDMLPTHTVEAITPSHVITVNGELLFAAAAGDARGIRPYVIYLNVRDVEKRLSTTRFSGIIQILRKLCLTVTVTGVST